MTTPRQLRRAHPGYAGAAIARSVRRTRATRPWTFSQASKKPDQVVAVALRGIARLRAFDARDALADKEPRSHRALSLHLDRPAWLALELVLDELIGRVAEVDAPRHAVRLHPARRVHGVAPDVEHELAHADDPAHAGPAVHAEPDVDP